MTAFKKWAVTLAAPLLLTGCFVMPGKFGSTLDLRRDGSFTFSYKGEILFQSPDEMMKGSKEAEIWNDDMAVCYNDNEAGAAAADAAAVVDVKLEPSPEAASSATEAAAAAAEAAAEAVEAAANAADAEGVSDSYGSATRACKKAEIAEQKQTWMDEQKRRTENKRKESAAFASMFGYAPGDEKAMTAFAAKLAKYRGWKSVVHQGKGRFLVDYQLTGRIGHDFVFPVLPEGDVVFPFVQIRARETGKVYVNTPGLLGGGMGAMAAKAKVFGAPDANDGPDLTGIVDGRFTLTTDGEVLTNNSEDGPAKVANGRSITWVVNGDTKRIPEALIQLD